MADSREPPPLFNDDDDSRKDDDNDDLFTSAVQVRLKDQGSRITGRKEKRDGREKEEECAVTGSSPFTLRSCD